MDSRSIIYGETALETLVQWLRATGTPQDLEVVVQRYLEILRELVVEDHP